MQLPKRWEIYFRGPVWFIASSGLTILRARRCIRTPALMQLNRIHAHAYVNNVASKVVVVIMDVRSAKCPQLCACVSFIFERNNRFPLSSVRNNAMLNIIFPMPSSLCCLCAVSCDGAVFRRLLECVCVLFYVFQKKKKNSVQFIERLMKLNKQKKLKKEIYIYNIRRGNDDPHYYY